MTEYWMEEESQRPKMSAEELAEKKEARFREKREKRKPKPGELPKYVKGKKEGMDLEKRVQKKWNDVMNGKPAAKTSNTKQRLSTEYFSKEKQAKPKPTGRQASKHFSADAPPPSASLVGSKMKQEAKRQANSGATWHAKGDIRLQHALMEVKERGTKNARGEKTISVPKEWLTKQADEAFFEGRDFWYLAFAYKGDDEIYLIKPYDHEIEMVAELRRLSDEVSALKEQVSRQADEGGDECADA